MDVGSKVDYLVSMGFEADSARKALEVNNYDLEASINCLLTGGVIVDSSPIQETVEPTPQVPVEDDDASSFALMEGNPIGDEYEFTPEVGVKIVKDITYEPFTHEKHMLNVHIPIKENEEDKELLPVVVHVHGGGWQRGDRSTPFYGGPFMGNSFAKKGFVCVVISYRTGVPFPDPVFDVAAAVKWTLKYIDQYGGDPNKLFISGHSAGGHLVSLLVSCRSYLDSLEIPYDAIKGVMAISGIYTIGNPFSENQSDLQNILYRTVYVNRIFGTDPDAWLIASPSHHIAMRIEEPEKHNIPPFCIFNATMDMNLHIDGQKFHELLVKNGISTQYHRLPGNHGSITKSDEVVEACSTFIKDILQLTTTTNKNNTSNLPTPTNTTSKNPLSTTSNTTEKPTPSPPTNPTHSTPLPPEKHTLPNTSHTNN